MKMKASKFMAAAVVVVLAVTGIVLWRNRRPVDPASIRIAANLPMSGELATYGVAVREGASMAIDEMKSGGASAVQNVTVDWQDNAGEPKAAVSIAQKQLLDSPTIYVSGVKPQTMAIKDEITRQGVPHFVWIFDAFINQHSTNNFRTWVSYKIEPPLYLQYASERHAKRIAITYVQLPHTVEEFETILVPAFKNKGGVSVFVEPYDFGRTDFKDVAAKLVAFKPDLIILNGFQGDLVGLIRSLRPLSAIADGNTIATYDLLDAAKILGPDEIEGIRIVAPIFETRPQSPAIASWKARFQAKYGRAPLYTHAFAYDMIGAIVAAARALHLPASHSDWIRALRAVDTIGVTGPVKFDSDGDMVTPLDIGVYRGGRLVSDQGGNQ
jgi:branched-chain amino acid transport system substrate-binding protein